MTALDLDLWSTDFAKTEERKERERTNDQNREPMLDGSYGYRDHSRNLFVRRISGLWIVLVRPSSAQSSRHS